MSAKKCPVCATTDAKLIRECQLRGVIPACLGAARVPHPRRLKPEDERIADDE
jgi:rRNA maturation protein Nop10